MTSSPRKVLVGVLAALLLTLVAACGGGSDQAQLSASEKKTATKISAYFQQQSGGQMTKSQTDCLGKKLVGAVGESKLKSSKLVAGDGTVDMRKATFDDKLAGAFADSYLGCYDYVKAQAKAATAGRANVDESTLETCMRKEIPNSLTKQLIVDGLMKKQDQTLVAKAEKGFSTCQQQATKKTGSSTSPSPSS